MTMRRSSTRRRSGTKWFTRPRQGIGLSLAIGRRLLAEQLEDRRRLSAVAAGVNAALKTGAVVIPVCSFARFKAKRRPGPVVLNPSTQVRSPCDRFAFVSGSIEAIPGIDVT